MCNHYLPNQHKEYYSEVPVLPPSHMLSPFFLFLFGQR